MKCKLLVNISELAVRFSFLLAGLLLVSLPAFSQSRNENFSTVLKAPDFTMELVRSDGTTVEIKKSSGWQTLTPEAGEHYTLRLTNTTNERIMILASIDGVDPYTGRPAILGGKGPVIDPGKSLHLRNIRAHKKAPAQPLQLDPTKEVGVIDVASFRERMDYPHLLPWSDNLAERVGGDVRKGQGRGELLWIPPSGAPFRRLSLDSSGAVHVEYGTENSITSRTWR